MTADAGISQLGLVVLAVADVDRAIDFYVQKLDFEKRTDVPFGGKYRWVEVYPPAGTAGIALAPPRPGEQAKATETGISLTAKDIDATHEALKARGVDVDEEVARMGDPVPPMFWLRDSDGHSLLVVEER